MGIKETNSLLEKLTGRVTALEKRPARAPRKEKWDTDRWIALGILVVTFAGVPLMFFGWLEPHLHNDLKSDIKNEVSDQLKDPLKQIGEIAGDLKEIKGQLETLSPLIHDALIKKMQHAESLSPVQLKTVLEVAKHENVRFDEASVKKTGERIVQAAEHDHGAWDTALTFLDYKSFLNSPSLNLLPSQGNEVTHYNSLDVPGLEAPSFKVAGIVPVDQAAQVYLLEEGNLNKSVGNQYIFGSGGGMVLDGMRLKNVVLVNVYISYKGGPLSMENVYFINCKFDVAPQSNGKNLAVAILQSGPATSFITS